MLRLTNVIVLSDHRTSNLHEAQIFWQIKVIFLFKVSRRKCRERSSIAQVLSGPLIVVVGDDEDRKWSKKCLTSSAKLTHVWFQNTKGVNY